MSALVINQENRLANYDHAQAGERVTLKTLTLDNMSSAYFNWLKDPDVISLLEIRHVSQTNQDISNFVSQNFSSPDNLLMGIFINDGQDHIGNIKLGPINWRYLRADIGLMIGDKSLWGKGYASEAIALICELAFEHIGLHRLQAGCYASNIGSVKTFEKAGFVREGELKDYWILDGKRENQILLGRIAP